MFQTESNMPATCSVVGCFNGYRKKREDTDYQSFQYPKCPLLRKKWKEKIFRQNHEVKDHDVVCAKHFRREDFLYVVGDKDKEFGRGIH